jgi:tetratricopeptide (TPR) repeat protein
VVTVSHEALLWHWPRVSEWVDQNRENLRIRGRISVAAERWAGDQRPSDLLLPRGKPLGEAETLLEQDIDLNVTEAEFINASMAKARRTRQLKGAVFVMLAFLTITAGSAAFLASEQRNRAIAAQSRAEVEAETAKRTTEFMVGLFEVSDPSEALGNTITAREIMDRGAQRIETELSAQPAIQATLMGAMGAVYTSLGLYEQAAPLLQSSLDKLLEVYGGQHLEVARTYNRLGEVLARQAAYDEAGEAFQKSLDARLELLGEEHLEVAESLAGLGEVLTQQGAFEQAEPLLRRSLELRTAGLGKEDLMVAYSLERLGLNLFDQGDLDAAEPYLREAVDIRRRLAGGKALPALANGLNDLGYLLYNKGDLEETEGLWTEALEMNRQLLDPGHPDIAFNLSNLALVSHDKGNYKAAESLYREVLESRRQALPEDHPDIASTLNNLAFLLYDMGDRRAAIDMETEAVSMYQRLFSDGHPALAGALATLGGWLTREGRFSEAEQLLDESLAMRRIFLGATHPEVAGGMTSLAHLYLLTGRAEEARKLANEARLIFAELLPSGHWRTAWTTAIEGASLSALRQFGAAEPLLLESYETLRQNPAGGSRTGYIDEARGFLVALYQAWGKPEAAARHLSGNTIASN